MSEKILILGGTKEAAKLAGDLVDAGYDVTTSLAGRTKEPEPVKGAVRFGGFGGPKGLANYIRQHAIARMIDATHPFAGQISLNAKRAAEMAQIPLERQERPPWQPHKDDRWVEVETLEAARDTIPPKAKVLLALGSQHIDLFRTREDVHFIVRMVDPPKQDLPLKHHSLVLGKPPSDAAAEVLLFKTHDITHIVCRNSGGSGAYAKIEAARKLGLPVIMVARP